MSQQLHEALKALEEQKKMAQNLKGQLDRALQNNVNLYHENKKLKEQLRKEAA